MSQIDLKIGPKINVSILFIGPTYGMLKLIERFIDTCSSTCAVTDCPDIRNNKIVAFIYMNKNS